MTAWLPNVVPDEPIESVWGNKIRDRTVTPFPNAAARTTAIPVPTVGMVTQLADKPGALWIYANAEWQRIGAHVLGFAQVVASSGPYTAYALVPGLSVTVTVPAGNPLIWVRGYVHGYNVASGNAFSAIVRDGAATIGAADSKVYTAGQIATVLATPESLKATAAGAHTYTVWVGGLGGNASHVSATADGAGDGPAFLQVINLGNI